MFCHQLFFLKGLKRGEAISYTLRTRGMSVNASLTIRVRLRGMSKIRPGLIAILILGGPASIILAHQKLKEARPQVASETVDVAALVQQAYAACSQKSVRERPAPCTDYIRTYDDCTARKDECDPRSVYHVLQQMNPVPATESIPDARQRKPTDA
jgi:hypothetical protein